MSVRILSGGEFDLHRKNFNNLREMVQWALSLLDPMSGQAAEEKASELLGEILSYFSRE